MFETQQSVFLFFWFVVPALLVHILAARTTYSLGFRAVRSPISYKTNNTFKIIISPIHFVCLHVARPSCYPLLLVLLLAVTDFQFIYLFFKSTTESFTSFFPPTKLQYSRPFPWSAVGSKERTECAGP